MDVITDGEVWCSDDTSIDLQKVLDVIKLIPVDDNEEISIEVVGIRIDPYTDGHLEISAKQRSSIYGGYAFINRPKW